MGLQLLQKLGETADKEEEAMYNTKLKQLNKRIGNLNYKNTDDFCKGWLLGSLFGDGTFDYKNNKAFLCYWCMLCRLIIPGSPLSRIRAAISGI